MCGWGPQTPIPRELHTQRAAPPEHGGGDERAQWHQRVAGVGVPLALGAPRQSQAGGGVQLGEQASVMLMMGLFASAQQGKTHVYLRVSQRYERP